MASTLKVLSRVFLAAPAVGYLSWWKRLLASASTLADLKSFTKWCEEQLAYASRFDYHPESRAGCESIPVAQTGSVVRVQLPADCASNPFITDDLADNSWVFIDHADTLAAPKMIQVLIKCAAAVDADVVYPDEAAVVGDEGKLRPYAKPGFSIDLFRVQDFVGPVVLIRAGLLRSYEGVLQPGSPGFVYDLLLHAAEAGHQFHRASEVQLKWKHPRRLELDTIKQTCVADHLTRVYGRVGIRKSTSELASIVIPTRDRLDLLKPCIDSIARFDAGIDYEIVIVDNDSQEAETRNYLESLEAEYCEVRVLRDNGAYSWSALNNLGASSAKGGFLAFLNNDIEVLHDDWLGALVKQAQRPDIAIVGPLLVYPNGAIQHAGIVLGMGGWADHVYRGIETAEDDWHPFVSPFLPRNVSACTGACYVVERSKWQQLGRFDQAFTHLGDLVLALKALRAGYLNLYEPRVRLIHREGATRQSLTVEPGEIDKAMPMMSDYLLNGDPYYNPNLDLDCRYPRFLSSQS